MIIVTGGKGFIGQAVVKQLNAIGEEAFVADKDFDIMENPLPKADGVIHLAGVLGTSELFWAVDEAIDVNVKGTVRVLNACIDHNMPFVGITMPAVWANVYQATKACSKILATAWHESFGVPVSHVRAFNAFGEGQKYGKNHPQKIIPTFATLAWEGKPIPIWGNGEQTVDLIYVDDIAKILVEALSVGNDVTIDAGSGIEHSVNDIAKFVLEVTGSEAGIDYGPMRAGEREDTKLCATGEGWEHLSFTPSFNQDDLEKVIRWYKPSPERLKGM